MSAISEEEKDYSIDYSSIDKISTQICPNLPTKPGIDYGNNWRDTHTTFGRI